MGNAFGQLFNGQGHLGGMPATVEPKLWGVPAARHEAACASGGIAVLAAMAEIEAGRYDCALVLGAEQERNVPGDQAARLLGAAAWVGHEGEGAKFIWPHTFSRLADEYERRYGLDARHLSAIAELNFRNAKRNPNAQTRSWTHKPESFTADDVANPVVEGRVRRTDCSQVTDGGAGLVLAGRRTRRALGAPAPRRSRARAAHHRLGASHRRPSLRREAAPLGRATRTCCRTCARPSPTRSRGPASRTSRRVDGIETHDCFTPSEYMAIDHFGITPPGKSWQADRGRARSSATAGCR